MTVMVERFFTPGLAQVAYGIADPEAGVAAIIDPRRDIDVYAAWAVANELRIVAVLETHIHADFVSGVLELAASTGATVYTSALGEQGFPHQTVTDGQAVEIGAARLRGLWTPGHTPEHMSYLLFEADREAPVALFSGDALFVGEVGRPDLLGEEETAALAGQLYHTVVDRLARLPGAIAVYPGHTAGSACGKQIGEGDHTTIGREQVGNYAFQARSKEAFVDMVLKDMPKPPTYYPVLKRLNAHGPSLLSTLPPGRALTTDDLDRLRASDALIVDARAFEAFGSSHIPGATFSGLGPNFTAWMGWLAPYDREIVLVLAKDADYETALIELRRIGLDRVAGYLAGGMDAWRSAGREVATLDQVSVQDVAAHRDDWVVLDVRSDAEWEEDHIAGAVHHFAGDIVTGGRPDLPPDQPVAVICGSGYRSSVAASVLQAAGVDGLMNVAGGMSAWKAAELPVTRADR